jgi:hypothetical protein
VRSPKGCSLPYSSGTTTTIHPTHSIAVAMMTGEKASAWMRWSSFLLVSACWSSAFSSSRRRLISGTADIP